MRKQVHRYKNSQMWRVEKNSKNNKFEKSSSSNLIFQTRFSKNQVQINRGKSLLIHKRKDNLASSNCV